MMHRGTSLQEAEKVGILVHGRGSTAQQILGLADYLNLTGFALLAPEAPGNTWYPYSFMAPISQNQPHLDRALDQIDQVVASCIAQGKSKAQLYFIGFSQGACLTLEYTTRNATSYGGIIAFTGGLIGEKLDPAKYKGDFAQTPLFIGASHKDMHVPLSRIEESEQLLQSMNANVHKAIFPDNYHTIREDEIKWVNRHLLS